MEIPSPQWTQRPLSPEAIRPSQLARMDSQPVTQFEAKRLGSTSWAHSLNHPFLSLILSPFQFNGWALQHLLPLRCVPAFSSLDRGSDQAKHCQLPYRSRFGKDSFAFTDASSFWANNCLAKPGTNGFSHYNSAAAKLAAPSVTTRRFRSVTKTNSTERLPLINEILDVSTASDIPMPEALYPPFGIHSSNRAVIFQMLPDQTTGTDVRTISRALADNLMFQV